MCHHCHKKRPITISETDGKCNLIVVGDPAKDNRESDTEQNISGCFNHLSALSVAYFWNQ